MTPGAPRANQALLEAGLAAHAAGDRAGAESAFRRAAALEPREPTALYLLGLARFEAGDADEAARHLEAVIALRPAHAQAWLTLAALRKWRGEPDRAAEAYGKAVELEPANAAAHRALGLLHIERERPELAEGPLLRAIELDPSDKEAHACLSTIYCRASRFEDGRRHALRALELDPSLIGPRQNLAGILAREGRQDEARRLRDEVYGAQCLFVAEARRPARRVLLLTTTDRGNLPERHLLPADRYTRLFLFVEYASPAQMRALPPYDVVLNAIGDQDATGPTAAKVAQFLDICAKPVLNHPERVARTRRDLAPELFEGIADVVVPPVARIEADVLAEQGLTDAARLRGLVAPMLVRPIGSHGGEGLRLIEARTPKGEANACVHPGSPHYVTGFRDFRSPDGLYRKYRLVFVDRCPYPYHLAIGDEWMVHYEASGTARFPERLAEELRFLQDPRGALGVRAMTALSAIGERLDLDFCGVDFTVLDDGRVLVFEANATMLVHPEAPEGPLAHKNPFVERIFEAFAERIERT